MDLSQYVGKENGRDEKAEKALDWHDAVGANPKLDAEASKKDSYIGAAANSVWEALGGSHSDELSKYSGNFVKTASLFLRGRAALPLTLAAYALDEAKPADSLSTQVLDAGLGAAKGGTMRAAFSATAGIDNIALKGVTLGVASRASDLTFSRDTYRDSVTGELNLGLGFQRVGQGVFSKEAIATDVIAFGASAGMLHNADRVLGGAINRSPFLTTALTGTTFGITSGGLEELNRQKQTGQFDAGAIAQHAALRGLLDTVAALPGGIQARAAFSPSNRIEAPGATRVSASTDAIDNLARKLSTGETNTNALLGMEFLNSSETRPIVIRVENPNKPTRFTSEEQFLDTAVMRQQVDARVYSYSGTEIAIPRDYAAKLDVVRDYRAQIADKPTDQHGAIAERLLGRDAPLANRALPEDFAKAIDLLPNSSSIRRLTLLDQANPEDTWHQKITGDPNFRSLAAAGQDGEVTFYKADNNQWLSRDVAHEWSHLLRDSSPVDAALFDAAARLEDGGYLRRQYAATNAEENFAVHLAEDFLHPDADFFYAFAEAAPLRASVFAQTLKPVLESSTSPLKQEYLNRVDFIERNVVPQAKAQLGDIIKNQNDPRYDDAGILWLHLGEGF